MVRRCWGARDLGRTAGRGGLRPALVTRPGGLTHFLTFETDRRSRRRGRHAVIDVIGRFEATSPPRTGACRSVPLIPVTTGVLHVTSWERRRTCADGKWAAATSRSRRGTMRSPIRGTLARARVPSVRGARCYLAPAMVGVRPDRAWSALGRELLDSRVRQPRRQVTEAVQVFFLGRPDAHEPWLGSGTAFRDLARPPTR